MNKIYNIPEKAFLNPCKLSLNEFIENMQPLKIMTLENFLQKKLLYLSKPLVREIAYRSDLPPDIPIKHLSNEKLLTFYDQMITVLKACRIDKPKIYFKDKLPQFFVLTEFNSLQLLEKQEYELINDALIYFLFERQKILNMENRFSIINRTLDDKKEQLNQLISHLQNLPLNDLNRKYFEKIGKLLIMQKHLIPPHSREVEIVDYFDPGQKKIRIRINPKLSLQKNAELFFKKSKESHLKQQKLEKRLNEIKKRREQIEALHQKLSPELRENEIDRIEKQLNQISFLKPVDQEIQEQSRPYKVFEHKNWYIWVGKNARSNDELTFHFAHKEDFWLHAQGVSGSHVVVRNPDRRNQLPRDVLEFAAGLAVRNSIARHSSYAPVLFTQVKYVRKVRGAKAGEVVAERIKTIFIETIEL